MSNIIKSLYDSVSNYIYYMINVLLLGTRFTLYKSREEIINEVISSLTEEDKEYIRSLDKEDVISLHHTLGMQIRNYYWMWDSSNPYTGIYVDGDDDRHPDNYSFSIIEDIWKKLQG